jgi:hypothetical protein
MLGPLDYMLWLIGFLAEIGVLVYLVSRKQLFRNFPIVFYMLCDALVTCGLYYCVQHFGFNSTTYSYFYYYTDSVLNILMFCVIMKFYQETFVEMGVSRYIRGAAVLLIILTGLFSYAVVHENRTHLTTHFVVEMSQNVYFVGVVLTYLLWGAILKLRETRTRLIQLVLALGIYFSADAGSYALRNLFPGLEANFLRWIPPLMGVWLPLAWAYTFAHVQEDARLEPARLMVRAR